MADADDALLAMRRPAALSLDVAPHDAAKAPLTTPKKRWMLRWRLQHQQETPTETETETLRVATPAEARRAVEDSRSPSMGEAAEAVVMQAPTASISPSAKTKDPDAARPRTPSPVKMPLSTAEEPSSAAPLVARTTSVSSATSSSSSVASMTSTEFTRDSMAASWSQPVDASTTPKSATDPAVAPPVESTAGTEVNVHDEDSEAKRELTESELRRLARRKKRKSNWDVGDPRKHGGSLDLAALNLLSSINPPATHPASFAKFPRQRQPYRHSHSLDPAAGFHPQPRTPVFGNSTAVLHNGHASPPAVLGPTSARRPFHHSSSLPLERTRSLTRHAPPGHNASNPNGSYR